MNMQEAFDKAYLGVVAQGEPSLGRNRLRCKYRGDKKARCPIGFLIEDKDYKRSMEGIKIDFLLYNRKLPDYLSSLNVVFLVMLQRAHDEATSYSDFTEQFKRNMNRIALIYELKVPETKESKSGQAKSL